MENQTTQTNQENTKKEWVFLPLLKTNVLKRTDTYVLIDIDGTASGIISAKFLRKKETDDKVFFSIPEDYEINCRVRELKDMKWVTTKEFKVNPKVLKSLIIEHR